MGQLYGRSDVAIRLTRRDTRRSRRAVRLHQAEGFVGGSELRRVFIEDDGDGNILQEIFEVPFVLEGGDERAVPHFFQDFDGDAAGDVHATEGEDFEREVTGFGAVDVGPEVESFDADGASFVEAVLGDFGSGVGVSGPCSCRLLPRGADATPLVDWAARSRTLPGG